MTEAQTELFDDRPGEQRLDWAQKDRFRRIFTAQAVRSYLLLSLGMGLVALALPLLLLLSGQYPLHYSISHYYYGGDYTRNVFVGCLWATGVFLFLYHGLSTLENWILNVAGLAAIGVAMNPMGCDQCPDHPPFVTLHASFAILFFLCLAIVAVVFAKERVKYIIYPPLRRRFKIAYNVAGGLMIAMPGAVAALHFLPNLSPHLASSGCPNGSHWVFWVESLGIWAFSLFWFVKTVEYRVLLGARLLPKS